jgi:competence protein ComEC
VPTVCVERGSRVAVGALEMTALHPGLDLSGLDTNNRSLVARIIRGDLAVLIPGDLEAPGEDAILSEETDLRSQVLIAGHHGSRRGTTRDFLQAVAPEVVVIAAGRRNVFGHPHRETLVRIRDAGARVVRTDLSGTVILTGTSTTWVVEEP